MDNAEGVNTVRARASAPEAGGLAASPQAPSDEDTESGFADRAAALDSRYKGGTWLDE